MSDHNFSREIGLALANLMEAQTTYDKANADCDYSWGYYGHNEIEALERANKDFLEALESVIDEQIKTALRNVAEFLADPEESEE